MHPWDPMKWTEEWSFACFYKFWSILLFSCDIFVFFSWNKCGSYLPTPPFPRKSNQNNKSISFMSLVKNFVTVYMCVYSFIMSLCILTIQMKQASKTGKAAGLQRFLLSFRCQGAACLRARVLTAGSPEAYFLFRDRIWSCAFRDRWREIGEGRECCPWSC